MSNLDHGNRPSDPPDRAERSGVTDSGVVYEQRQGDFSFGQTGGERYSLPQKLAEELGTIGVHSTNAAEKLGRYLADVIGYINQERQGDQASLNRSLLGPESEDRSDNGSEGDLCNASHSRQLARRVLGVEKFQDLESQLGIEWKMAPPASFSNTTPLIAAERFLAFFPKGVPGSIISVALEGIETPEFGAACRMSVEALRQQERARTAQPRQVAGVPLLGSEGSFLSRTAKRAAVVATSSVLAVGVFGGFRNIVLAESGDLRAQIAGAALIVASAAVGYLLDRHVWRKREG